MDTNDLDLWSIMTFTYDPIYDPDLGLCVFFNKQGVSKTTLLSNSSSFIHFIIRSEWSILTAFLDSIPQGPCNPYKLCNPHLYIGIIIFPHIDNTVYRLQPLSQLIIYDLKLKFI